MLSGGLTSEEGRTSNSLHPSFGARDNVDSKWTPGIQVSGGKARSVATLQRVDPLRCMVPCSAEAGFAVVMEIKDP